MKKIKVLMSSTNSFSKNGVTKVMINLYKNINKNKFQIDFISISEVDPDIKKAFGDEAKITILNDRTRHPFLYIKKYAEIAKEYDIVHVHGNSSIILLEMLAALMAGVKIRIAHSHNSTCKFKIIDRILRLPFYVLCNGRLACGEEAGKWLFNNHKFKVINNGIDTKQYQFDPIKRNRIRQNLGWQNQKIIGHVGNFVDSKNHKKILEIFEHTYRIESQARLLLVGAGDLENEIKERAKALGIEDKVFFAGSVDNVLDYLCAIDVILMPSLFEGLPLTLVEEQANGLKCLISDNITQNIKLTSNVYFLSLSDKNLVWADKLLQLLKEYDRDETSKEAICEIMKKGFDSKLVGKDLENYYYKKIIEKSEFNRK